MKRKLFFLLVCALTVKAQAQMSYQVSLLNTATGEPRANVTVNATATITNSQNETIYTSTQRATSNDFGVLQLVVGNAETFKGLDTGKLPLFIEVSVDGTKIGKTQIMTVPVAEVATTLKSSFTKEQLTGKDWVYEDFKLKFTPNGDFIRIEETKNHTYVDTGKYEIEGNNIYIYDVGDGSYISWSFTLRWINGALWPYGGYPYK